MNIFIAAYRCNPYGLHAAESTFNWAEVLGKRYDVTLATPKYNALEIKRYYSSKGENLPYKLIDIPVFNFSTISSKIEGIVKPGYFIFERKLVKYLENENRIDQFDFIFRLSPTSYRFPSILHKLNKPLLVGILNGGLHPPEILKNYFKKETLSYKLRYFDKFILKSKMWMSYLDRSYRIILGVDYTKDVLPARLKDKIFIIPGMGIEKEKVKNIKKMTDTFTFLFVGQFRRYKGGMILLEAFNTFKKKYPDLSVILKMVGDGEERKLYENYVKKNDLDKFVKFLGWLPQEKVFEIMEQSSAFVYPSINEGLGNVYLEAISKGLPIICTDYGGGGFIVTNDCGIKIKIDREDSMIKDYADAMFKMATDKLFYEKCYINLIDYANNIYSWDALSKEMYKFIDDLKIKN